MALTPFGLNSISTNTKLTSHWGIQKLFPASYGRANEGIICINLPTTTCVQHWAQVKNKGRDLRGVDMSKQVMEVYLTDQIIQASFFAQ